MRSMTCVLALVIGCSGAGTKEVAEGDDPQIVLKDGDPKVAKSMCVCQCAGDFIPVADTTDLMKCREYNARSCINRKGDKRGQTSDCQIDLAYPGKPHVDDDDQVVEPDLPASPPPAAPDAGPGTAPSQPGAVQP